jgi:hypothetical protein
MLCKALVGFRLVAPCRRAVSPHAQPAGGGPFLIRRPEYIYRVDFLLEGYLAVADAHERMGDLAGARERKRLIAELRQLRSEMLLLAEAERDGSWVPESQ